MRGKPNPLLRIGETDHGNRVGEEIWALKDVSFQVQQGEVLGVIGRNGAGKSTLLKILSRVTAPSSGEVKVKGRIASLLEVGTGFHPELTGRENIYLNGAILGMTKQEVTRKFDEIVDFSGVEKFIDTPVKRYSSGMYVRLAFAVAAHLESEILLVDEVLAVGDAEFQKKCLGKMGDVAHNEGRTVLFVSHNMAAVQQLCMVGILINNGQISKYSKILEVIDAYLISTIKKISHPDSNSNTIYISENSSIEADLGIKRIEIYTSNGEPKNFISTWDDFTLRINFHSENDIPDGSIVLQITSLQNLPILRLSTRPDSNVAFHIRHGENEIDCEIQKIPLSSGTYNLNVGFAIPKQKWLGWFENITQIRVFPKDVYQSGLAPIEKDSLLAIPHIWKVKK